MSDATETSKSPEVAEHAEHNAIREMRLSIRAVCLGNQDMLVARLQRRRRGGLTISYRELFAELIVYIRELRATGRSFQDVWADLRERAEARWEKDRTEQDGSVDELLLTDLTGTHLRNVTRPCVTHWLL